MKDAFDAQKQNQLAEIFHALHDKDKPLILANAWNAMAAKVVELGGLPAVATTSSGISWSCGYADGEHTPPELMIEEVRKIARVVEIPVSADIESGYYGYNLEALTGFIEKIIKAGAVGINLEDSNAKTGKLISIEENIDKIRAVRKKAGELGVSLYINARVDAMTLSTDTDKKLEAVFKRAKAYEEAGASGIFVPFIEDIEIVKAVKEGISLPLNILMAKTLDVQDLKDLKINRISVGGRPSLVAQSVFKNIIKELQTTNQWKTLFSGDLTHPQANRWFE